MLLRFIILWLLKLCENVERSATELKIFFQVKCCHTYPELWSAVSQLSNTKFYAHFTRYNKAWIDKINFTPSHTCLQIDFCIILGCAIGKVSFGTAAAARWKNHFEFWILTQSISCWCKLKQTTMMESYSNLFVPFVINKRQLNNIFFSAKVCVQLVMPDKLTMSDEQMIFGATLPR